MEHKNRKYIKELCDQLGRANRAVVKLIKLSETGKYSNDDDFGEFIAGLVPEITAMADVLHDECEDLETTLKEES